MCKIFLYIILLLILIGCGDGDPVRSYTESSTENRQAVPPPGPADRTESSHLSWRTPEGWQENQGSGMRRAWFRIDTESGAIVCTLVVLPGDGGGLKPNISRWLAQLNTTLASEEALERFITGQSTFRTTGGFQGVLIDFTPLAKGDDVSSMLVSVISLPRETVFVKILDKKKSLTMIRSTFIDFCKSFYFASGDRHEEN